MAASPPPILRPTVNIMDEIGSNIQVSDVQPQPEQSGWGMPFISFCLPDMSSSNDAAVQKPPQGPLALMHTRGTAGVDPALVQAANQREMTAFPAPPATPSVSMGLDSIREALIKQGISPDTIAAAVADASGISEPPVVIIDRIGSMSSAAGQSKQAEKEEKQIEGEVEKQGDDTTGPQIDAEMDELDAKAAEAAAETAWQRFKSAGIEPRHRKMDVSAYIEHGADDVEEGSLAWWQVVT